MIQYVKCSECGREYHDKGSVDFIRTMIETYGEVHLCPTIPCHGSMKILEEQG